MPGGHPSNALSWESLGSREGPAYIRSHFLGPQQALPLICLCGGGVDRQDQEGSVTSNRRPGPVRGDRLRSRIPRAPG